MQRSFVLTRELHFSAKIQDKCKESVAKKVLSSFRPNQVQLPNKQRKFVVDATLEKTPQAL